MCQKLAVNPGPKQQADTDGRFCDFATGTIPVELSKLTNLEYLFLDNNNLIGP